jgi:hypothetical protein
MAFSSSAVVAADDPVTQFSAGGRSVAFTIAANSTTAVFSSPPMLLTGTVAGTITLTAAIPNGPPAIALASGVLPAIAPRVTSADASRSTNRITVVIAGYSTERRVIDISFSFEVRTSSGIQRVNVSKTVDPDFTAWYQSPPSVQFGSTFVFQQLFGIDGDSSSIEAVTATLRNGQGSTASPRIVIPAN